MLKRTKILCTIGPSTNKVETLVELINVGMNAARLNFSHGTHQEHLEMISNIREASRITNKPISLIQDLQGPKIRTGKVENGKVHLEDGAEFTITIDDIEIGNSEKVSTNYKNLVKEVKAGNEILLDDGYMILKAIKVIGNDIHTRVIKGGVLKNNKGIVTPGVTSTAPSLSEKDLEDLKFGLEKGVDVVALSFVRSERDILELKTTMKIFKRQVPIIAKIERFEGVNSLEAILEEVDAIMVARGDLGLEMPTEQVPALQKEIIDKCNFFGKPVITATQMLESMINNPRPTRAEASDVANAVLDGTDCVMLSGETSVGKYPIDAVSYMCRIIKEIEKKYDFGHSRAFENQNTHEISDAMGQAATLIAEQIDAKAIVAYTGSTFTAKNISKYRPRIPIIGISDDEHIYNRLALVWGIDSKLIKEVDNPSDFELILKYITEEVEYINPGDRIVYIAGLSDDLSPHNMIKVVEIPQEF